MLTDEICEEIKENSAFTHLDNNVISIYETHLNVIAPLIIQLETLDGEYPIEVLNEIRAIFTHLARSKVTEDINVYEDNIIKAESHAKRAVLDCFKYLCVAYDDQYHKFEHYYKNVDISLVDNGEFLPLLLEKRQNAVNLIQVARKNELQNPQLDNIFSDFEAASNAYAEVYNMINESSKKLQHFKGISAKKNRWRIILDILGIIGTVFGIIGVVLTINS